MLTKYKWIAIGVAVALIASAAFGAGFQVSAWESASERADLIEEHARELHTANWYAADLERAIAEANAEVLAAKARADAAEQARTEAQKRADDLAAFSKSRMDKLERTVQDATTSVADVLRTFWELRQ